MQSITTLNLNLQHPNYAVTMHAVQNDKLTRKVTALLFDGVTPFTPDEGSLATVRFHKPDNTFGFYDLDENGNDAVTWSGNVATVNLSEQALTCPGIVLCQIQFYKNDGQRLSTFTWKIDVEECAISDEQIISTDYFSILTTQISAALSITYRPPYINTDTGHWMTWSVVTNQYEDSGYSAAGTQGPTGATGAYVSSITRISGTGAAGETDTYQVNLSNGNVAGTFDVYNGEDGTSIASVTRTSGTGAGGTTDTYTVTLTDGTVGGTFQVYNGADGQGAPGSATPLMDGTAAVGTATAYSREDHVHPSDTSKVDVESGKGLSTNDFTNTLKNKLDGIDDNATYNVPYPYVPTMDGGGTAGTSPYFARGDHSHPSDTTRQKKNIYFKSTDPECTVSSWTAQGTPTYTGFGYRADIYISGVNSSMYAIVTFSPDNVLSGNYCPVCETHTNGIYIYSKENTAITLQSIVILV